MISPLIFALTGREVEVVDGDIVTAFAQLREAGWTPESLRAHRLHADVWPHPVPTDVRGDLGFAQLKSQIDDVITTWNLAGPTATTMNRRLSAREQDLLNDVPPHFGRM